MSVLTFPAHPQYLLNRVKIEGLQANTDYFFRIEGDSKQYKFKTMPANLNEGIRFVCAGDVYSSSLLEVGDKLELATRMHRVAASQNPLFVFLGGDLAYAGDDLPLWIEWLKIWTANMLTSDGRMIPVLTAVGNHDFIGDISENSYPDFTYAHLFSPVDDKTYYVVDFLPEMSFFALDTDIVFSPDGVQRDWLKDQLIQRKRVKYKFAIYHVPAYPSYRDVMNSKSEQVRESFCPLFDQYGVSVAFENHDHTFKRTKPILNDRENPRGIIYVGDGAMGVNPDRNPVDDGIPWFLEKWAQKRYCLAVDLNSRTGKVTAIDEFGGQIDQFTFKPRAAD